MELYLFLQEILLSAFVALLFSFLFVKLFSIAVTSSENVDHVKLSQKGDQEPVKLNKVLKVGGTKSKRKRVRFVDQVVDKVDRFSGVEGSALKEGDSVVNDGGLMFDEMTQSEVVIDDIVREGSGEIVRVMEVLGVEERCDSSELEGGIVDSGLGESNIIGDEKCMRLFSDDDVIGDQSELVELVVDERTEANANQRNLENQDLTEITVEKKDGSQEAVDDKCVGLAVDDAISNQSGEFEVWKESVVEERSEGNLKGGDVVNASFDEKINIEEAGNVKMVGLGNDDVLDDHTREARVSKELVSVESDVSRVVKEGNIVNSAIGKVVISEKVESEMFGGGETSLTLASGGVAIDHSGEVRVVEVSQGTGVGEEMDKGNNEGEGLLSDEDDDWEGIERSDLEKVFAAAANYVDNGGKVDKLLNLGNDEQMQLYALHKVAMEGPCYEAQPMALKISARAKWNAWQRLGNMSPEVAMEQYVSLLSDKDPGWPEGQISVVDKPDVLGVPNPGVPEPINKQIQ